MHFWHNEIYGFYGCAPLGPIVQARSLVHRLTAAAIQAQIDTLILCADNLQEIDSLCTTGF